MVGQATPSRVLGAGPPFREFSGDGAPVGIKEHRGVTLAIDRVLIDRNDLGG